MIIFPSLNIGVVTNKQSRQCVSSPYRPNDYCYLQVINSNPSCCDLVWDQNCEDLYLNCVPPKLNPIITISLDPNGYIYNGTPQGPGISEVNKGGSTGILTLDYNGVLNIKPSNAGSYTLTASVSSERYYNSGDASINFEIQKANPTITSIPSASDIEIGQTLSYSILTNGGANTAGVFAWEDDDESYNATGTYVENITFYPDDSQNYNSIITGININIIERSCTTSVQYSSQTCFDSTVTERPSCCYTEWDTECQRIYNFCMGCNSAYANEEDYFPNRFILPYDDNCVSGTLNIDTYCCSNQWDNICDIRYTNCKSGALENPPIISTSIENSYLGKVRCGYSTPWSGYIVTTENLISGVAIRCSGDFYISKTDDLPSWDNGYQNLFLETGEFDEQNQKTIYVKYKLTDDDGYYNTNNSNNFKITHATFGGEIKDIFVSASSMPIIELDKNQISFNYVYDLGDTSREKGDIQYFTISGSFICDPIELSFSNNEDYVMSSDGGVTWTNYPLSLYPDENGILNTTTIAISFEPRRPQAGGGYLYIYGEKLYGSLSLFGLSKPPDMNIDFTAQTISDNQLALSWRSFGFGDEVFVIARRIEYNGTKFVYPADYEALNVAVADSAYGNGTVLTNVNNLDDCYLVYRQNQIPFESNATVKTTITNLIKYNEYLFTMIIRNGSYYYPPFDGGVLGDSSTGYIDTLVVPSLENIIAQWNFNGPPGPSIIPNVGALIATLIGIGVGVRSSWQNGSRIDVPGATNYSLGVVGKTSGTIINKSYGIQINVNTSGKYNVIIYWDNYFFQSTTKYLAVQYTLNKNASTPVWVDYVAQNTDVDSAGDSITQGLYTAGTFGTWYFRRKADFSNIAGVSNNSLFGFRLVAAYAPNTNGYTRVDNTANNLDYFGGVFRIDSLTVTATNTP